MISGVRQNAAKVRKFAEIDKLTNMEKGRYPWIPAFSIAWRNQLLFGEKVVDLIVVYDFFLEGVSTGFRRLNHLDHLGVGTTFAFVLHGCNCFFSHGLSYLISL
jgi:hypothetical protein